MRLLALVSSLILCCNSTAFAQDAGRALTRGEATQAAAALTHSLTAALRQSSGQLSALDVDALRTGLAGEFVAVTSLPRGWSANLDIDWRDNAAPPNDRRGACGGFVDIGDARVTTTSTSRARSRGLTRLTCTLMSQTEDAFGWTGFAAISAGDGALVVHFTFTSRDPQARQAAAPRLARALESVLRSVAPAGEETPRPQPRQPQTPRPPPIPDIDDTI